MQASCQCGLIQFTIPYDSPLDLYACHCTQCRAQSASAFGVSARFKRFELPFSLNSSDYTLPDTEVEAASLGNLETSETSLPLTTKAKEKEETDIKGKEEKRLRYDPAEVGVYSRGPTGTGFILDCFFCRICGVRLVHSSEGKETVNVKAGCIKSGLDWTMGGKGLKQIWCGEAVVPVEVVRAWGGEMWVGEPGGSGRLD
jgi:hypothetical protein